jgi:integrase
MDRGGLLDAPSLVRKRGDVSENSRSMATVSIAPADPKRPHPRARAVRLKANGLARRHWSNAGPIRKIFKEAFARAGLPYFNPHSFRKTLAQLGQKTCGSIEAMSQNLGHEELMTTFASYGSLSRSQQAEIIGSMSKK